MAMNPLGSPELQRLGRAFADLQAQRHRADYDLSGPFTRVEVMEFVSLAEQARADWNTLKTAAPELAQFFSVLLLLRGQLGARK